MPQMRVSLLVFFLSISAFAQQTQSSTFWSNVNSSKTASKNQDSSYRELSYDDLVQEFNTTRLKNQESERKSSMKPRTSSASANYLMSLGQYQFESQSVQIFHQGFGVAYTKEFLPQISWGVQYKNMPSSKAQNIRIGANEVDGMVIYSGEQINHINLQLATGIAVRLVQFEDANTNSTKLSTQFVLGAGVNYQPTSEWVIGIEPQVKSAFLTKTVDRTAFDLNFKAGARF